MRICYLARSPVPSRSANSVHVMKMCAAYAALGHRVTLVAPRSGRGAERDVGDPYAFYGVPASFRLLRLPLPERLPGTLTYGLLVPLIALLLHPDLVHSRSLAAAWGAACMARLPTLYELHDAPPEHPRPRRMLRRLATSQRLAGLVVITRALAARVAADLPASAPRVAPDAVDAAALELDVEPAEARRALGVDPEGRKLAVYTGHLYPGRGVGLILELARRRPDHLFLLVGGTAEDVARRREQAAGLANVRLTGFVAPAEVPLYLRAADLLLMPYADRVAVAGGGDTAAWASPLKMFEYLAAGRPILASTLPVLREVLEDGVNSLLLPHDQPELWDQACARLASDPELAERLSERARTDARRYTWEARARELLSDFSGGRS